MTTNKRFLFCDLEATGLGEHAGLLEIYMCLTNHHFKPGPTLHLVCGKPIWYQFEPHPAIWDEEARAMHEKNGLLEEMKAIGCLNPDWAQVQKTMYAWLQALPGKPGDRYLAGSSVHTDRDFLAKIGMPIGQYVSHRHFDLASFKALDLVSGTKFLAEKKVTDHRARTDVEADIEAAKLVQGFWRSAADNKPVTTCGNYADYDPPGGCRRLRGHDGNCGGAT